MGATPKQVDALRGQIGEPMDGFVFTARNGTSWNSDLLLSRHLRHQRCWVHKMRNILEKVRRRDEAQVKAEAQKIYLAQNVAAARRAFERFRFHWRSRYPAMVRQLEQDLPELLHFFALPPHL